MASEESKGQEGEQIPKDVAGKVELVKPLLVDAKDIVTSKTVEACKDDAKIFVEVPFEVDKGENEGEDCRKPRTFRVVAPYGLPPGYRLDVMCGDEYLTVRVPEGGGGVPDGQEFIANEVVPKPIMGRWYNDIFGFRSRMEGNFTAVAFFLPPVATAIILDHFGRDCCGRKGTPFRGACAITMVVLLNLAATLQLSMSSNFQVALGIYLVTLGTFARYLVRKKYRIRGSCPEDCLWTYFCNCCSSLQMYRHLKASGEEPRHCCRPKPTEAEIV